MFKPESSALSSNDSFQMSRLAANIPRLAGFLDFQPFSCNPSGMYKIPRDPVDLVECR
jgi:hypothetical protein